MIRVASLADIPEIAEKVHRFNDAYVKRALDPTALDAWIHQHLTYGSVWLSDNGILSALVVPDPVRDSVCLLETAWYDDGRDGIRLLRTFMEYGRAIGVDELRMSTLNTSPAGVTTLLERMGFEATETVHSLLL